jgi:predicted RNA-binding protein YlxR (DUF448 family)
LCNPPDACLAAAVRRRAFERAFRRPVDAAAVDAVHDELKHDERDEDDEGRS